MIEIHNDTDPRKHDSGRKDASYQLGRLIGFAIGVFLLVCAIAGTVWLVHWMIGLIW